ncbi:lycopene cyclase domain-containing protein [Nesterenkonia xinjiangensis]|uniref:Lycopene cyclase domain-containing protein n=1 Tax=Nesterenkonia xinjiangensis TaxID=225327 RepID=A0A7Z0K8E9_9MICC|nr:lycopene cyclase domain-containing protein [Nesterenkonia xinjiangensis]
MTSTTYLLLCAVFLAIAALVAGIVGAVRARRGGDAPGMVRACAFAAVVLLVLTAVFDNVMIAVGLFTYAEDGISGIRVGLAPIEDFAYPLAAVILLPALWLLLEPLSPRRRTHDR